MQKLEPSDFAAVCFLVLMANGAGYMDKHPTYIKEKLVMLKVGYNAYAFLDRFNQKKVLMYLNFWKYELPEQIAKYEAEVAELGI